ncbi:hypothetical protein DFJ58DRAFT_847160 [Suillus subalutaceus]|uniref:uncharacterized protein n=1 Tax=Suillus subalutaceus TaxID=48586 RepID=UPI001B8741BD|nr:uncharacterized protein DFJ58DRAFT_847160 [Suillus subalutaceus]KAG1836069.1 hypothetical protein DFJ58DRAFT_847160 [Suillus subalutaceus]
MSSVNVPANPSRLRSPCRHTWYGQDMKLAGILYLHDITQSRMFGTMLRDLDVFRKLCGEDAEKNVIMVTTKWAKITAKCGTRAVFWKEMMTHGSTTARFDQSRPWDVMRPILANKTVVEAIRIQKELVDFGKKIPETDAGIVLYSRLKKVVDSRGEAIEGLKKNAQDDTQLQKLGETEKEARELLSLRKRIVGRQ